MQYEITSHLRPEEVYAQLKDHTDGIRQFKSTPHKPFEGTVTRSGFTISLLTIHHRNALEPVFRGQTSPTADGSRIHVTVYPHWSGILATITIPLVLVTLGLGGAGIQGLVCMVGLSLGIVGISAYRSHLSAREGKSLLEQVLRDR